MELSDLFVWSLRWKIAFKSAFLEGFGIIGCKIEGIKFERCLNEDKESEHIQNY